MQDLLKQLEQNTIVDARNKTAIIPYDLFYQFAAHVQQLESQIEILQMQASSGIRSRKLDSPGGPDPADM